MTKLAWKPMQKMSKNKDCGWGREYEEKPSPCRNIPATTRQRHHRARGKKFFPQKLHYSTLCFTPPPPPCHYYILPFSLLSCLCAWSREGKILCVFLRQSPLVRLWQFFNCSRLLCRYFAITSIILTHTHSFLQWEWNNRLQLLLRLEAAALYAAQQWRLTCPWNIFWQICNSPFSFTHLCPKDRSRIWTHARICTWVFWK